MSDVATCKHCGQPYPNDPAEALVHDLDNMLGLYRAGRVTAEDVAGAVVSIRENYEVQKAARARQG